MPFLPNGASDNWGRDWKVLSLGRENSNKSIVDLSEESGTVAYLLISG